MNKKVSEITESVETLKALLRKAIKKHEIQRLNTLYLLIMVVFITQNRW